MKILTVIQARINSTRLPGKVLMPICNKALLVRMVERVEQAYLCGTVVVATTTDTADDAIEKLCESENIECFRGHPLDLLDRHYKAALHYKADVVLKIPSDCPLIDPEIIDRVIIGFCINAKHKDCDYMSNLHPATYPDGNDVEVMSFEALETAWKQANRSLEREHTTPYLWENPEHFKIKNVEWENGLDYSKSHRWTIDYKEDYDFIKAVYEELYPKNNEFGLKDILNLIQAKPEIAAINKKYAGEYWYKNHIAELKTVSYEPVNA